VRLELTIFGLEVQRFIQLSQWSFLLFLVIKVKIIDFDSGFGDVCKIDII
jgi:hypothetical protein